MSVFIVRRFLQVKLLFVYATFLLLVKTDKILHMVFNFLVHNIFLTLNFLNSVYQKSQIFSIDKYCIIFSFIINPPSIITCLKLFKDIIKKKINLMMGKIQIYQKGIFQITVLSQTGFPENMYYLLHKEKETITMILAPFFI